MTKRDRIIYWVATLWLSLGMVSTGIVQLLHVREEVDLVARLGYSADFLTLLGVWKLLGVVVILLPGFTLAKEWAYAGFFFSMSGAIYSHIASGSLVNELWPPALLLVLTIVSWFYRPPHRRILAATQFV